MKVLHVVSWYPTLQSPKKAPWILNHIKSLDNFCINDVLHIEVEIAKKWGFERFEELPKVSSFILKTPVKIFFLIEIFTFFLSCYVFFVKVRLREYSVVNFHIAYPQLVYYHYLKKLFFLNKVYVTEHWSAYHFDFNIKKHEKLKRIKSIFRNDLHWITVSEALKHDLIRFSGSSNLRVSVVPNVVDTAVFQYDECNNRNIDSLFMVGNWQWPKQPLTLLHAFMLARQQGLTSSLRIGGYGKDWQAIEEFVHLHNLDNSVTLLGSLNSEQIAEEMRSASAYLHCSEYETFSVVCAEALCCGTPVLASKVGGITEFVDKASGILIENSTENWVEALLHFSSMCFSPEDISRRAQGLFCSEAVGKRYFEVLNEA
jgi:L-malate glycosyltransferase